MHHLLCRFFLTTLYACRISPLSPPPPFEGRRVSSPRPTALLPRKTPSFPPPKQAQRSRLLTANRDKKKFMRDLDEGGCVATGARWMEAQWDTIADLPLNRIALLGTHNSGSYACGGRYAGDAPGEIASLPKFVRRGLLPIVRSWAQCQNTTVLKQLRSGARMLDLRIHFEKATNAAFACHGLVSAPLSTLLNHVRVFVDNHPHEVVVLNVHRMHVVSAEGRSLELGSVPECIAEVMDQIGKAVGSSGRLAMDLTPQSPLKRFIEENSRIVVINRHAPFEAADRWYWSHPHVENDWPDSNEVNRLFTHAAETVVQRASDKMHIMELVRTPQGIDFVKFLLYPKRAYFRKPTDRTAVWLQQHCHLENPIMTDSVNIIFVDMLDAHLDSHLLKALADINKMKLRLFLQNK
ncbi:PLC-like phosphodiesterase [Chytriomyces sp. MP71]|nr:PLC-like phosphodiesterase [Chytriomyces sp. MP71]